MKGPFEIVHIPSKIQLFEQWMQWHHAPHHACVHVCSLPCAHFKSWIPNELIDSVHTQQRRLAIDKCKSPNKIQMIVPNIVNGMQNMRMVSQTLNHEAWTMKSSEFNKFQTPFQKKCWCTHFKLDFCKCWNDLLELLEGGECSNQDK
jgi:hypothetical protein